MDFLDGHSVGIRPDLWGKASLLFSIVSVVKDIIELICNIRILKADVCIFIVISQLPNFNIIYFNDRWNSLSFAALFAQFDIEYFALVGLTNISHKLIN